MSRAGALLALAALGPALGCAPSGPGSERVVLIVVDTLRADALPFHGGAADDAPFLGELARRSLVFDTAWSASSWTAPATASLFTSVYPEQHGVVNGVVASHRRQLRLHRLPEALETIPVFLREQGFRGFGVSANPNVGPLLGFERGFERFRLLDYGRDRGDAAEVVDALLAWRDEILAADRAFLYLHLMDPHEPLRRGPFARRRPGKRVVDADREAYRDEVRRADAGIAKLFAELPLDDALVIVTSDHGEEFLDHGGRGHGFQLYSELIHVPLIVHLPGGATGRVSRPVSTLDVLPTLRSLLGAPPSGQDVGRPLLGREAPGAEDRAIFAMRTRDQAEGRSRKRAVMQGGFKLIVTEPGGRAELYDLSADPREQRDLAAEAGEALPRLRARLDAQARSAPAAPSAPVPLSLSDEQLRQLEELGYAEDGS